ncbi:MAG: hypothetical protein GY720_04605 [bacterium]|nr:hypothetical protein [bacterium]
MSEVLEFSQSEGAERPQRAAIVGIQETSENGEASVTITLTYEDAEFSGHATGSASVSARPRIVGEATLRAVESVTNGRLQLTLDAIATTDLGESRVAMAQVGLMGSNEPLVGSALVQTSDSATATVKAVLDALNRRMAQVLA